MISTQTAETTKPISVAAVLVRTIDQIQGLEPALVRTIGQIQALKPSLVRTIGQVQSLRAHSPAGGADFHGAVTAKIGSDSGTWHHGLVARWWAEFNVAEPQELDNGYRRRTSDGDEIELITRIEQLDPLEQTQTLAMRARLWRGGQIVHEESYALKECLYFAQEVLVMLEDAGFRDLAIEGNYTGRPATSKDGTVVFVARK